MHLWADLRDVKLGHLKMEIMMEVHNDVRNIWPQICIKVKGFLPKLLMIINLTTTSSGVTVCADICAKPHRQTTKCSMQTEVPV